MVIALILIGAEFCTGGAACFPVLKANDPDLKADVPVFKTNDLGCRVVRLRRDDPNVAFPVDAMSFPLPFERIPTPGADVAVIELVTLSLGVSVCSVRSPFSPVVSVVWISVGVMVVEVTGGSTTGIGRL
jgi:hypothetical protein